MSETIGRLLAAGNVAEVFEWGSRVVKLYRSSARKPTPLREAAVHAAVEAMALPVPAVWGVVEVGGRWGIGLAGYCATKGGVRLFAKAVAMECAAEGDGIRINTVHPGVIDTPIWTKISSSAGRNTPIDPNEVSKSGVPLGRVGQAQDIANGVLFLASDASNYMTGAELVIDGGMTGGAVRRWT